MAKRTSKLSVNKISSGIAISYTLSRDRPGLIENLRIVPVFGPNAFAVSPRIGHIHVTVDDAPWRWADASGQPLILNGFPAGPHKVLIELENANHQTLDKSVVTFVIPKEVAPDTITDAGVVLSTAGRAEARLKRRLTMKQNESTGISRRRLLAMARRFRWSHAARSAPTLRGTGWGCANDSQYSGEG